MISQWRSRSQRKEVTHKLRAFWLQQRSKVRGRQRTHRETNTDFFLLGTAPAWWPHLFKSPPSLTLTACEPLGDKAHLSLPQAMTKGLPHLCSGQSWGHIASSTNKNTKEKLVLVAQVCNPGYKAGWGRRSQSSRFYITWIYLGNSVSTLKKTSWGDRNS